MSRVLNILYFLLLQVFQSLLKQHLSALLVRQLFLGVLSIIIFLFIWYIFIVFLAD
jgi:hypothetical protein